MMFLNFITTIIVVILFTLFVDGQTIPRKCCDPMYMPVNAKCQSVKCRNDDQCATKFQSYCTKYNTGQSICRGISKICGCNKEDSNFDKNYNKKSCPANQKCQSDGKCDFIEPKCTDPNTVRVNLQCQKVKCSNNAECSKFQSYCTNYMLGNAICSGTCKCNVFKCPVNQKLISAGKCGPILPKCPNSWHMHVNGQCETVNCNRNAQCTGFQSYCTNYKLGQSICRPRRICGCNGDKRYIGQKLIVTCNYKLGDSDKCGKGNICLPSNVCGPPPKCAIFGNKCHPTTNKCCDKDVYWHQRLGMSFPSCVRTAFVKESCKGGIPCERDSYCIKDKCSLCKGDACNLKGSVCPPNTKCKHVALRHLTNKMCVLHL